MDIKLPKNTVLHSLTRVSNIDSIQNVSCKKMQPTSDKEQDETLQQLQVQSLLPEFPEQSSFQSHTQDNNKPPIKWQDTNVPLLIQKKLNAMLNNEFICIISKSPADFSRTNLVEMDLPTTGPPFATKPLKYKSFVDNENKSKFLSGLNDFTFMYLDDVLIFSQSYEDHLQHLHTVFQKFKEAGLKIKLSKCQFFKIHLHYLEHRISDDGLELLLEKLEAIKNVAPVKNVGLLGYYRSFIPAFADITLPITNLLKKNTPFM